MSAAPQTSAVAAEPVRDADRIHLARLRCPAGGRALRRSDGGLVTDDGAQRYAISGDGVPLFAPDPRRPESRVQQAHYDRIAGIYVESLDLPHTRAYSAYLDHVLLDALAPGSLGYVGEICCGRGEAIRLVGDRADGGVGIDISPRMLAAARRDHPDPRFLFVQGDATALPLADAALDNVFVLGGIHHVNDRARLFAEIHRVLKPGGRLYWREPLDDFFAWRWLRAAVYRLSPTLDHETEQPLRRRSTTRHLERAGLELTHWRTCGFVGFCVLMNSDVLVVNRVLRHLPGIGGLTRLWAKADDWCVRLPGLRHAGLQVVGAARKSPEPP
jgi:SAM-dependent methyltransferase